MNNTAGKGRRRHQLEPKKITSDEAAAAVVAVVVAAVAGGKVCGLKSRRVAAC